MRKGFHHMIIDCWQRDAEFEMDLLVGFLLDTVHCKDTRGLLRELPERDFQCLPSFTDVHGIFLSGAAWRVCVFQKGLGPDPALLPPRLVHQQI